MASWSQGIACHFEVIEDEAGVALVLSQRDDDRVHFAQVALAARDLPDLEPSRAGMARLTAGAVSAQSAGQRHDPFSPLRHAEEKERVRERARRQTVLHVGNAEEAAGKLDEDWLDPVEHEHSAMGDLLGRPAEVVCGHTLYRCLDKLLIHKRAFFSFLRERWETLFEARFDVLLYDPTSTYFESAPPFSDRRRFGYGRDKRGDCVQVVIVLIVTPQGFPLACEVMPGNKTTLAGFLEKIEAHYDRSDRAWIMDRGIPTEETLAAMCAREPPVHYLVGTPKGRLTRLEKSFVGLAWRAVREPVEVKLLSEDGELHILAQSRARIFKERGMRRRRLQKLWQRLHELRGQSLRRDELLLKLGAAKKEAGRAWHLVDIRLPEAGEAVTPETFTFALRRDRLRRARRREGRYLLRSNLTGEDPGTLWRYYMRLTELEQAFKEIKHDVANRPVFHQREERIEAHIFVAFIAYCLHVTLKNLARPRAPGLTPSAILEKFSTMQLVDVHLPATDGRHLVLPRRTDPQPCLDHGARTDVEVSSQVEHPVGTGQTSRRPFFANRN